MPIWFIGGGETVNSPVIIAKSTGPVSHTGDTVEHVLATIPIAANSFIAPGTQLRVTTVVTFNAGAQFSFFYERLDGQEIFGLGIGLSDISGTSIANIVCTGSNGQTCSPSDANGNGTGFSNTQMTVTTVDMTTAQDLTISIQLTTATDTFTLVSYTVEQINP